MAFPIQASILEYSVLALLANGDSYGYVLTQSLVDVFSISESTLYPVLRRLKKITFLRPMIKLMMGEIAGITP